MQGLAKGTLTESRKCDLRVFVLNTLSYSLREYHTMTLQSSTLAPLGLFVLKANSISSSASSYQHPARDRTGASAPGWVLPAGAWHQHQPQVCTYLTRFLVLIRGALTPPPMMLEPVM